MDPIRTQVLVVGGGPGGYVAAIRAGQLGLTTVLVEADRLGGTCLIRGCIPSKALIHVAGQFEAMARAAGQGLHGIVLKAPPAVALGDTVRWKEGVVDKLNAGVSALLKRAKVRVVKGWATFSNAKACSVDTSEGKVEITAEHVILANGSLPVELPNIPFGGPVIYSTEALMLDVLPKKLVVVGAGYIGLELGIAFRKLGAEVTVVETLDRVLPLYDAPLVDPVRKWLEKNGIKVHLGAKAQSVEMNAAGAFLVVETKQGAPLRLEADKILVTVGRKPNTQGWGLETMAVDMDGRFVKVDDQCRTSMRNVWAVGDLVGEPMLEHKATKQGEMVAEIIAGHRRRFEPASIPAVCFTEPEIVSAGLLPTDKAAKDASVTLFPFSANGRALSTDAAEGFVRIVSRKDNHRILGIQAVGAHVSELSGEFSQALEMGAVLEDIAGTIHVHPTLSEAFHEAAWRALGQPIHI
jgi:dihydrolipoamide dehydrogenase